MRITTQMLAEAQAKNNRQTSSTSLLDVLNNQSSQTSAAGSSKQQLAATLLQNKQYDKLADTSKSLTEAANSLLATGDNSLFSKALQSNDTEAVTAQIVKMTEEYNSCVSQLSKMSGSLNEFYTEQITALPAEYKDALSNVGVTQNKDGSLSVDSKKLKNASLEDLKKAFGSDGNFMQKLSYVSGRVSSNAQANLNSVSSQYGANGLSNSTFEASRYNFLG